MTDPVGLFDAHAHVVSGDSRSYPPQPISGRVRPGALDDPMTAERLLAEMDAQRVERAVVVQRAHIYGYDNSYVVDVAQRYPDRFQAICVIDSDAADAAAQAARWLDRGAVGIRLTEPARGADGSWLLGGPARAVWDMAKQYGASISIQLYTWNRAGRLPEILAIVGEYPAVPVIVEHLSNIAETADAPDYGVDAALDALAVHANMVLKLTTINLARCDAAGIDVPALVARLVTSFGADRLVWGSDVGQSPQAYARMTQWGRAATQALDPQDQDLVLHGTARRLFGV